MELVLNISGMDGRPTGTRTAYSTAFRFQHWSCLLLIAVSSGLPRLMLLLLLAVRGPQVLDKQRSNRRRHIKNIFIRK